MIDQGEVCGCGSGEFRVRLFCNLSILFLKETLLIRVGIMEFFFVAKYALCSEGVLFSEEDFFKVFFTSLTNQDMAESNSLEVQVGLKLSKIL